MQIVVRPEQAAQGPDRHGRAAVRARRGDDPGRERQDPARLLPLRRPSDRRDGRARLVARRPAAAGEADRRAGRREPAAVGAGPRAQGRQAGRLRGHGDAEGRGLVGRACRCGCTSGTSPCPSGTTWRRPSGFSPGDDLPLSRAEDRGGQAAGAGPVLPEFRRAPHQPLRSRRRWTRSG